VGEDLEPLATVACPSVLRIARGVVGKSSARAQAACLGDEVAVVHDLRQRRAFQIRLPVLQVPLPLQNSSQVF
jgi:hypothetical protein